jgi:hypothetical protein
MRQYLLTEKEKALIRDFLDTGKTSDKLRVLRSRCKKLDFDAISAELDLIKQFLAKRD